MAGSIPTLFDSNEQAEEWRPVPVHPFGDRYDVSNLGFVRNRSTGLVLKGAPNSKGYLCVNLYAGEEGRRNRSFTIHKLVCIAFQGPCPPGMQANHKDTNKQNNRADNLEWTTPLGNTQHAIENGRAPRRYRGGKHKNAKLTDDDVRIIKIMARLGVGKAAIGRAFKVDPTNVNLILSGQAWAHVPEPVVTVA